MVQTALYRPSRLFHSYWADPIFSMWVKKLMIFKNSQAKWLWCSQVDWLGHWGLNQGYRNFEIQIGPLDRWRHRRHTNMSSTIPNSHENSSFSSKSVSEIDYFSDRVQLQPVVSKRSKDNPKSLASDRCLLNTEVHQYPLWCLNPPIFSVSQRVSFFYKVFACIHVISPDLA